MTRQTDAFITALNVVLYAPLASASLTELRRYAKGLITKPSDYDRETLLIMLMDLRDETISVFEEPSITFKHPKSDKGIKQLTLDLDGEQAAKKEAARVKRIKEAQTGYSEDEFLTVKRVKNLLGQRLTVTRYLNTVGDDSLPVLARFVIHENELHILGKDECLEEIYPWERIGDIKQIVSSLLDNLEEGLSYKGIEVIAPVPAPEPTGYDADDAYDKDLDPDCPVPTTATMNPLVAELMAKVEESQKAGFSATVVKYTYNALSQDDTVPNLGIDDDGNLTFKCEKKPCTITVSEDDCTATLYFTETPVSLFFETNNPGACAAELTEWVLSMFNYKPNVPDFDSLEKLPTAQEICARIESVAVEESLPTVKPLIEEVIEEYATALESAALDMSSINDKDGGTVTYKLGSWVAKVKVQSMEYLSDAFDTDSQIKSVTYVYRVVGAKGKARFASTEYLPTLELFDAIGRVCPLNRALTEAYSEIQDDDKLIGFYVADADGNWAIHAHSVSDPTNWVLIGEKEDGSLVPTLAQVKATF